MVNIQYAVFPALIAVQYYMYLLLMWVMLNTLLKALQQALKIT